jgi:hypothetical protein
VARRAAGLHPDAEGADYLYFDDLVDDRGERLWPGKCNGWAVKNWFCTADRPGIKRSYTKQAACMRLPRGFFPL